MYSRWSITTIFVFCVMTLKNITIAILRSQFMSMLRHWKSGCSFSQYILTVHFRIRFFSSHPDNRWQCKRDKAQVICITIYIQLLCNAFIKLILTGCRHHVKFDNLHWSPIYCWGVAHTQNKKVKQQILDTPLVLKHNKCVRPNAAHCI